MTITQRNKKTYWAITQEGWDKIHRFEKLGITHDLALEMAVALLGEDRVYQLDDSNDDEGRHQRTEK